MTYKRPAVLDLLTWIHTLLLLAGPYPLLASLFGQEGTVFWRVTSASILLLLSIFLSWFLMQRIHNFLLYLFWGLMISILCGLLSFLWGGIGGTGGRLCFCLAFAWSLAIFAARTYSKVSYGRMKEEFMDLHGDRAEFTLQEREMKNPLNKPSPFHWIWFTLLYLLGMLFYLPTYLYVMFGLLFADIFVCLGFCYINALYEYIRQNQKVASLPVQTMGKIHRFTGIIGALLLVLFLLPSLLYGKEFKLHLTAETSDQTYDEVMYQEPETGGMEITDTQIANAIAATYATPKWVKALIRVLCFGVLALLVVTAIILFVRWIRRLGHDFSVEEEDEVVFLDSVQEDDAESLTWKKERSGRLSADQQIRKRYRKTIRKATKGQPDKWATPSELEQNASLPDNEATQALHEVYEKARYSEDGCTHEDLSRIK